MWLQGSTTWANLDTDIAKLLCGEINDGVGANAGADAWVRDISTAFNSIRTPASVDKSLPAMSDRAGYWKLLTSGTALGQNPGQTPFLTVAQQLAAISNTAAATHGRILMLITVASSNTVAGNYSTASVQWRAHDADTGTSLSNGTVTPTAGGIVTLYNGITVTLSDPSGILSVNAQWARGFTGTYIFGIDFWPWYPFRSAVPTFTTAPPGTAGTDYDLIDQVPASNIGYTGVNGIVPPGGFFTGMGCKTSTSVNGAKYTTNVVKVADQKLAINKSVNPGNGYLDLTFGPMPQDSVASGGGLRPSCCPIISGWLRCATTPASVTGTMAIQYWISVKPTGIVIILNADPGQTGKMGTAAVVKADNVTDPTYDFEPWYATERPNDLPGNQAGTTLMWTRRTYFGERRRRDGSWGTRDWQTGHMRSDFLGSLGIGFGFQNWSYMWMGMLNEALGFGNDATITHNDTLYGSSMNNTVKPESDGNWHIYGFAMSEASRDGANIQGNFTVSWPSYYYAAAQGSGISPENAQVVVRGTLVSHYGRITGGGWSNGDELTDSVTGAKYLLVQPDYPGTMGRMKTGSNQFDGGTAVRENL